MPNHGSFLGIPRELRDLIYPYLNKTISAYKTDAGVPIKIQKVPLTSMQLVSQQMRAEYLASKPHDDITLVVLMNIFRLGHGRVAPPICATGLPGDKSLDRNSFIAVFKQARHLEVVVAVEGGASAHWDDRFFELLFYGYEGVWDLDSTSAWELQTMKVAVHHHFHMVDMQRADGAEAVLDVPVTDLRDLELRQHACAYHHQPAPFDVELKTRVYLYAKDDKTAEKHKWTKEETFALFPRIRVDDWEEMFPYSDLDDGETLLMILHKKFIQDRSFQTLEWTEISID